MRTAVEPGYTGLLYTGFLVIPAEFRIFPNFVWVCRLSCLDHSIGLNSAKTVQKGLFLIALSYLSYKLIHSKVTYLPGRELGVDR